MATYTVAICTLNRRVLLANCLQALMSIRNEQLCEVIVVDNGSSDGTLEHLWTSFPSVRTISEPQTGLSRARNRAYLETKTEYLVFLDDDAVPDPSWIRGVERAIEAGADVFGGPYRPFYLTQKPDWFVDELESAHLDLKPGFQVGRASFSGGNMGWRLHLLQAAGGFDVSLGMAGSTLGLAEETALQMKIRETHPESKFWFEPSMSMRHLVTPAKLSLSYIVRRNFLYGRMLRVFDRTHPMSNRSLSTFLASSRFGFPLIYRLFIRDRLRYPKWRTYAAFYLIKNSIEAGVLYQRVLASCRTALTSPLDSTRS